MPEKPRQDLADQLHQAYPELAAIAAAADDPAYIVGGAVRDALLGRGRSDNIDIVVEGDAFALAERLGAAPRDHDRFATAKVDVDGLEVDVASARTESYSRPGALPEVEAGAGIVDDLRRRDFSLNAIAVDLESGETIDPHGGREDLARGELRILHPLSFVDDPTRTLRAARYCARLGFGLEPDTARRLRETDLETITADRRQAELLRIAAEPNAPRGFELLSDWGLVETREGGVELAATVAGLLDRVPWKDFAPRPQVVLAAALGPAGAEAELAAARPSRPSEAVELSAERDPAELVLARALGADWLDDYLDDWAGVRLEIDGGDLIAAGIPEGPQVGLGLSAALRAKLDGELSGAEQELRAALEAARGQGA